MSHFFLEIQKLMLLAYKTNRLSVNDLVVLKDFLESRVRKER